LGEGHINSFLGEISETPEGKACLRDLFLTDPVEDKDALKRKKGNRASGTCSWILDTFELKTWLGDVKTSSNYSNILWLHGLPGKGKSTMAITLVEELPNTPFFASGQKLLAYFFCDSSSEDRTTATGILRGLLYQLVRQQPELLRLILPKYNDRKERLFSSFDSLWGVFMDVVNDPSTGKKYIIIDALDECESRSQETLLKQFKQSFHPSTSGYAAPNIRILITSRPHPEITEYLEQFNNKDISSFDESKRDMELFISERVAQLKARKKYTEKIAVEVTRILMQNEEGTFLWIGIACDELDKIQSKDVIQYLKCLPSKLYSLYQRLLDRCVQSNPDEAKIKRLLSVITVSRRPLSVSELSLACELYMDEEEEERLEFTRDEINSCQLLVIIRDDKVQLLHKSAKDFLMGSDKKHFINESKAHAIFAYRCVDHLLQHLQTNDIERRLEDDSFLEYSVNFWPEHAHLAKKDFAVVPSQADFFNPNSTQMQAWLNLSGRPQGYSIFHVAARWNILELIHYAMSMVYPNTEYHDNDFVDEDGATPLEVAIFFGHIAIFSALLERLNESTVVNKRVVITAAWSWSSKEFMTLLLENRRDQILITEEVVKVAIGNYLIGKEIIKVLLEPRGDQILITKGMINTALWNRGALTVVLEQYGNQIPITNEVIEAAMMDPGALAALLEQHGNQIAIIEKVVKAALWDLRALAVLLKQRGDQILIIEEVVKAALCNYGEMIVLPEQQADEIPTPKGLLKSLQSCGVQTMAILLDRGYIDNHMNPELVRLTVQFQPAKLVGLLLHRLGKSISITTEIMVADTRNERHSKEMITILLAHQIYTSFIIEEVLQEAAYHKCNALDVMALLLDRHNDKITITEQLVMAIATNQWELRNQLMLLLLSRRYNHVLATSPKVIELVARWFDGEVMTLFFDRIGSQVIITEKVMMAAEKNTQCGDKLKLILVGLTDQARDQPSATGEMVMAKAKEGNKISNNTNERKANNSSASKPSP
jgi:NACHT domain